MLHARQKEWGIDDDLGERVIAALSEFVNNAVIHGCPTVAGTTFPQLSGLGLIEIRLKLFEAFLALEVWDPDSPPDGHPRTIPHLVGEQDSDESGRGLTIVAALSDRWGVMPEPVGKSVFALFDLAPPTATSESRGNRAWKNIASG